MLINTGIPTKEDLAKVDPSAERLAQGPVAIVECFQEIPCNPCVDACKRNAITIEGDINGLPIVDFTKCNGCGVCIAHCPGLAIFVIDKTYSESHAIVRLPYEFVPLPEKGQLATALNRAGEELGDFEVVRVISGGAKNKTTTIWLAVPQDLAMEVRSIKAPNSALNTQKSAPGLQSSPTDTLICRCEDITLDEIRRVIADGYRTIDEIKRVTRAGMGPCQGRTCRQLIAQELSRHFGIPMEEVLMSTFRPPVKPVKLGSFVKGGDL